MRGTQLQGATLVGDSGAVTVLGITAEQLVTASWDNQTRLPEALRYALRHTAGDDLSS